MFYQWHNDQALKCYLFLLAVLPAVAGPMYTAVHIGGAGESVSEAFAISATGAVAGTALDSNGRSHGFAYEAFTQTFGSDTEARGINALGEVIGTQAGYATIWRGGSAESLGSLGGAGSYGLAISDSGYATGAALRSDGHLHAFLSFNGNLVDVGTLGGTWSAGYSVNSSGQIAGVSENANGQFSAFRWDASKGIQQLTGLGGNATDTRAYGLNSSGTVAGAAMTADGHYHAAVWDSEGVVLDLGSLGGGPSYAYGVNDAGSVVGYSYDALGRQRAFVWTGGLLFDLNSVVGDPDWEFTAAYAINARGQIAGTGIYKGVSSAFRLDPLAVSDPTGDPLEVDLGSEVPEPMTTFPVVVGLAALVYRLKR